MRGRSFEVQDSPIDELLRDLRTWLAERWDPDLTVGAWWTLLGEAGWAFPQLPRDAFGRGASRSEAVAIHAAIVGAGALAAPGGIGPVLAAPTIAKHGDPSQVRRYVADIVRGRRAWCQLFSEPGAGSDLASLSTRAEPDGDAFVVNGQKVWTSFGETADLGMLLARTDPSVPKHRGLTWMVLDMRQPGVDIRPLREMTGESRFSEVFLTDARVEPWAVVGGLGHGWAVAQTTLANERSGLGPGSVGGTAPVAPGSVAGRLDDRAGDHVRPVATRRERRVSVSPAWKLIELARRRGAAGELVRRQALARLHVLCEVSRLNVERQKAVRAAGRDIPGMANLIKLANSEILRSQRDVGLDLAGPLGTLHGYVEAEGEPATAGHDGAVGWLTLAALRAQGPPIYGGTDEIQRNIVAERVLGLPREASVDRDVPFDRRG